MIGWIFAFALMFVYVREPASVARPELIIAAALFAIAGSIGYGLSSIRVRAVAEKEEEEE